jgi:hypothetical protein
LDQQSPRLAWNQDVPSFPFELAQGSTSQPNLRSLAVGFSRILSITSSAEYTIIIASIRRLIIALDMAEQTGTTGKHLPELVVLRNWIQHRLLSLPASRTGTVRPTAVPAVPARSAEVMLPDQAACECTLEVVRLSLLILSTFIIFPVPQSTGLSASLNNALLACLDGSSLHVGCTTERHGELAVWAAMLGAISCGSGAEEQRARTIVFLADACKNLGIGRSFQSAGSEEERSGHGWRELKAVLCSFLWWESALNEMARMVWQDVTWLSSMEEEGDLAHS